MRSRRKPSPCSTRRRKGGCSRPLTLVNHNGLSRYRTALFYARKAYADPEARKHPDRLLLLLSYMAEDSHTNGDYSASVRYCIEGLELAKKQGSKTYEADFHVTWAKTLMLMAQHGEAFRHFDTGIGMARRSGISTPVSAYSKRKPARTQATMRGTSFSIPPG